MLERFWNHKRKPPLTAHPLTRVLLLEREALERMVVVVGFHDREVHFRSPSSLRQVEEFVRDRWRLKRSDVERFIGLKIETDPSFFGDTGNQEEISRAINLLYRESGIEISHVVSRILPAEIAFERRIVILAADPLSGSVRVALDNRAAKSWLAGQSDNSKLIKDLRELARIIPEQKLKFEFVELSDVQLGKLLDEAYPGYVVGRITDNRVQHFEDSIRDQYSPFQQTSADAATVTATKQEEIIHQILESSLIQKATDIDLNFEPTNDHEGHLFYRFFSTGQWRTQPPIALPLAAYKAICRTLFAWTGMRDPDFFGGPKEGTFKYTSTKEGVLNFRLAAGPDTKARFPNLDFYAVTFRSLRPGAASLPFERLGMTKEQCVTSQIAALSPFGLVVVAGRTGQGKGITQAAFVRHLKMYEPEAMVRFLVNPIEYDIAGAFQTDVGQGMGGRTWKTEEFVRNLLKRRPRVIAIPEVNDRDSAEMALYCSTSGHLTLVTIHAETPFSVMSRFQTYGIPSEIFVEQARLITSQVLVPRLCTECKEPVGEKQILEYWQDPRLRYLPLVYQHWFRSDLGGKELNDIALYQPRPGGCSFCNGIGYRGDVGVFEVLDPVEAEVREMMIEGASIDRIRRTAIENGHVTLHASGLSKVIDGQIDLKKFVDLADRVDPYTEGVPKEIIQDYKARLSNFGRKTGYKPSAPPTDGPRTPGASGKTSDDGQDFATGNVLDIDFTEVD